MKNIGVGIESPQNECVDGDCPFHGTLAVRGKILEGKVIKDHMTKTVIVRRDYHHYIPKYLRYERRHGRIAAHNPPCIDANIGDTVKIMECRPLSKTVSFVVIERSGS